MAKREDIQSDDCVGVILDTFHDRQRACMFVTNPLGIQQAPLPPAGSLRISVPTVSGIPKAA